MEASVCGIMTNVDGRDGNRRSGSVGAGNLVDDRPDREGKTVGRFWRNNAGTDNDISVGYRR